jgi:succinate dehydrogenase / fumarate reductase, cytochrome b subunit
MGNYANFFNTSIGRKVLMSLTGLFLSLFLIVHLAGNLQLFKNDMGLAFNHYSVFMTTFTPIKVVSYLLYATIILHVINGLILVQRNKNARPVAYAAKKDARSATWASKNMGLLGVIILIFLVTHMANFWYKYKFGDVPWVEYRVDVNSDVVLSAGPATQNATPVSTPHDYVVTDASGSLVKIVVVRDLYAVVKEAFKQAWLVALYIIGMIALSYHLVHGFQSAFQSMGVRHSLYTPVIRSIGVWFFGIIIPLLFAAMPAYFFFFN